MSKNLTNNSCKEEMIIRILQLKENSPRLWGKMHVTEMLHHINVATKLILSTRAKPAKSSLKKWFYKLIFFHLMKFFPKNLQTRKDLDVVGNQLETNSFEEEQTELLRLLNQIQREKKMVVNHPYFGMLNTAECGKFLWMHLDHHLRQFDV